ncbi:hypothetical protein DOFOFD_00405 [Acetobacteraceae bacterium EV16P]|uniref:Uncharacterized protein n=1 Tax=Sorlinia euscelidii TaxID=3081148 RepID=A0ABU7TYV2_9PROT
MRAKRSFITFRRIDSTPRHMKLWSGFCSDWLENRLVITKPAGGSEGFG